MRSAQLSEIHADASSVFVDNVLLGSAARALDGSYDGLPELLTLHKDRGPESMITAARFLFSHDLANLSSLCECLLLSDELYVNAATINRPENDILTDLSEHIVGLAIPIEASYEAQTMVVRHPVWGKIQSQDRHVILRELVAEACHGYSGLRNDIPALEAPSDTWTSSDQVGELMSFPDSSRPFGRSYQLAMSAGFYITCSQALGVPYRPSAIRADLLAPILMSEIDSWRKQAGNIALDYFQDSRRQMAEQYFENLASLDILQVHMPLVLAGLLKDAESIPNLIERILALRDSPEGIGLRSWAREMTEAIQMGSLTEIAPLYRELELATENANALLGIRGSAPTVALGYGPTKSSKPFSVSSSLMPPRTPRRHVWVLQRIYRRGLGITSLTPHVERVLFPQYPGWFRNSLKLGGRVFGDDYFKLPGPGRLDDPARQSAVLRMPGHDETSFRAAWQR